jgi:hypothetical protein
MKIWIGLRIRALGAGMRHGAGRYEARAAAERWPAPPSGGHRAEAAAVELDHLLYDRDPASQALNEQTPAEFAGRIEHLENGARLQTAEN